MLAAAGGPELKMATSAAELTIKTTIKEQSKTIITASVEHNGFNTMEGITWEYVKSKLDDYSLNYIFDRMGCDEN